MWQDKNRKREQRRKKESHHKRKLRNWRNEGDEPKRRQRDGWQMDEDRQSPEDSWTKERQWN